MTVTGPTRISVPRRHREHDAAPRWRVARPQSGRDLSLAELRNRGVWVRLSREAQSLGYTIEVTGAVADGNFRAIRARR